MQIEAGKSYKAANGERVGPMIDFDSPFHPNSFIRESGDGFVWDGEGRCTHLLDDEKDQWHLVAEWSEGPVRTETVTTRRIVPGVYGRLEVGQVVNVPDCEKPDEPARVEIDVTIVGWGGLTATELDSLAMVASQLAEALRDA